MDLPSQNPRNIAKLPSSYLFEQNLAAVSSERDTVAAIAMDLDPDNQR